MTRNIIVEMDGNLNLITELCGNPIVVQRFIVNENELVYEISGLHILIGYNLEIYLNIDMKEVLRLLPIIVGNIVNGNIILEDGIVTSDITGAPIQIMINKPKVNLGNDDKCVARLIFSDENYLLPTDSRCHAAFKNQIY